MCFIICGHKNKKKKTRKLFDHRMLNTRGNKEWEGQKEYGFKK